MAGLQGRFAKQWPVAVLTVAAVAAASLGDVFAGWHSFAGRGASAPEEYPVRIVLRQPGSADRADRLPIPSPESDTGSEAAASEAVALPGETSAEPGETPADMRLAQAAPVPRPATDGLLAIQFDLADPGGIGDGGSAIEIRKPVRLNGADAGEARIHVGASSTLSIAREELGRLLARSGQQALVERIGAGGRFVSFDEIRRQGIEVRYDPVSDRILVST